MSGTALRADRFICLPSSPFIRLPLLPSLDAWHRSLGVHLAPFVSPSLALCMDGSLVFRLSGWTDLFVSHCLPAWMSGTAPGGRHLSPFVSVYLSPVVSQPSQPVVSALLISGVSSKKACARSCVSVRAALWERASTASWHWRAESRNCHGIHLKCLDLVIS